MEKVKKENIKKIKKKRSFWKTYKTDIIFTLICLAIIGTMAGLILTDNEFIILDFLIIVSILVISVCCLTVIGLGVRYVIRKITSLIRQTKIPLTLEELDMLNIKTPKEYSDFLEEYLNGFAPIECDKILFISYVYLYNGKVSTEAKLCILNALYELYENKENNGNNGNNGKKRNKRRNKKRIITENDFKIISDENITLKPINENLISNSDYLIRLLFRDTWMEDVLTDHFAQIYVKNKAEERE